MQALSCPMIVPFFVVFLSAVFAEFWFPRLVWPAVLAWNTAPTTGLAPDLARLGEVAEWLNGPHSKFARVRTFS
jgi:hypothetical protein